MLGECVHQLERQAPSDFNIRDILEGPNAIGLLASGSLTLKKRSLTIGET